MNLERVIAVRNTRTVYKDSDRCVKVFDESYLKSSILSEALNLARIGEAGIKAPELIAVTAIEGRWALITEFIHGKTLAQLMADHPEKLEELLSRFTDIQLEIQAHDCPALPKLKDVLRDRINRADISRTVWNELQARLAGMPDLNQVCHGEFEPSNVIIAPDDQPFIIDWTHVTRGDGAADAAGTYLLFRMDGDISAATAYLNLFCEKSGTDRKIVNQWLPLIAAARSVSGNKRERGFLLSWANQFDEMDNRERT